MKGEWIEIKVVTSTDAIEPVSGIFYSLNVRGVSIEDPNDLNIIESAPWTWDINDANVFEYGDKQAVVKGYFSPKDDIEQIKNTINEKLQDLKNFGIDIGYAKIIDTSVFEEDWENSWKKYYKTVKIGKNIVIKPLWEDYTKADDDIIIEMDPGMAFGTGTHATTSMCVEALEENIKKDSIVFDIGTGSGILAITASKLNAKSIVAVDLDPIAVECARENVSYNKTENVEVLSGDLMKVVKGKADIVVANIIADVIIFLIEDVKNFILPGGLFICSGIIGDRKADVLNKLKEYDFEVIEVKNQEDWVCIVSKTV